MGVTSQTGPRCLLPHDGCARRERVNIVGKTQKGGSGAMMLTEEHRIKKSRDKELDKKIDGYCYCAKNLSNSVQYLICQCHRIHEKLRDDKSLDQWQEDMLTAVNRAITEYNAGRAEKKRLRHIDRENGNIADAYFLSWHMKSQETYRAMPYATCGQICIQEKCREWKSFYRAKAAYAGNPGKFLGRPRRPGYLDKVKGRSALVITSQNFSISEDGGVIMPGFLKGIRIRSRHRDVRQIRVRTDREGIRILLIFEQAEVPVQDKGNIMGIDLGVDNLATASLSSGSSPIIINGRPLKSINRYYNKQKEHLQAVAKKSNRRDITRRMERLMAKRNRKVRDYLHKASRRVIELAQRSGVRTIVIGNNRGWKQKAGLGKRTNQAFVSIPYRMLIDMIRYKAVLAGIRVSVINESYTSGTSYLDGEDPVALCYDNSRRIKRGLFRSDKGIMINADVNAAYQIMKAAGCTNIPIKERERVTRIKVA